jgi:hypothetical protein
MPPSRRAGIAARPVDRLWRNGFFHRRGDRSARRAIHVRTPHVQALLLPEPPPASTLIDWPDMGSSQVLFVREIDSFLRVPLSATGPAIRLRPACALLMLSRGMRLGLHVLKPAFRAPRASA